jgi:putative ABC transport system permease protein
MFVSMTTLTQKFDRHVDESWGGYGERAFLLLKPGTNPKTLEAKFPAFLEKRNGTEMKKMQMFPTLFLEPLRDVYLRSTRYESNKGNIQNVYIFSIVAIFILLSACLNFVNLTTARSAERAKEVGIRKVIGAGRYQLARQFIGESEAFALLFGGAFDLITSFNHWLEKS